MSKIGAGREGSKNFFYHYTGATIDERQNRSLLLLQYVEVFKAMPRLIIEAEMHRRSDYPDVREVVVNTEEGTTLELTFEQVVERFKDLFLFSGEQAA